MSSVSGKYLRNCAPTHVLRYITFDIVRNLEFICTLKEKSYNDGKTCVVVLVNADRKELQLLNHSLNFVPHIEYSCRESQ